MLTKFFKLLQSISPGFSKKLWLGWNQFLAKYQRQEFWTFMNYGFAELNEENPELKLEEKDENDRYFIQLYNHVANLTDIKSKEVLEVGSGRGGGSSFMARYHKPKRMVGIDFSNLNNSCVIFLS